MAGARWSEWPWVITARSTGRTGSMWKLPGFRRDRRERVSECLAAASFVYRRSCSDVLAVMRGLDPRIHLLKKSSLRWIAGSSPAMTNRETMPARLFFSSGDLLADRRYRIRARPALQGRSCRRRRSGRAGHRARTGLHLGLVHARRNPRAARPAGRCDRGVPARARIRPRGPARRGGPADAAWRRRSSAKCRRPMCRRCSINMRRASRRR